MNKLGLHIIGGYPGHLAQPRIVKLVDASTEYVRELRDKVGPACLIIVRWVESNRLEDGAKDWFNRHFVEMRNMADPNVAFEGPNEIPDSLAMRYAVWESQRLALMHAAGLRSVVGNWSVGVPDLPTWDIYTPMLAMMKPPSLSSPACGGGGDLLGLHEYWADHADIANRWHCGRWTLVGALLAAPSCTAPIVITECGRDVVEGKGYAGWQRSASPAEFLHDLSEYNKLLESFPNVLGACVFQVGSIDRKWQTYDVSSIWPQVVAQYTHPQETPPVIPTIILQPPITGAPRISQHFAENPPMYTPYGLAGHPGLDYAVPTGAVIRAPVAGTCYVGSATYSAYGTHLWIKVTPPAGGEGGVDAWVILAHLSRVLCDNREHVQPGNIVALSGNTGRSTGPHLHLGIETREPNPGYHDALDAPYYWQDPEKYIHP